MSDGKCVSMGVCSPFGPGDKNGLLAGSVNLKKTMQNANG